MVGFKRIRRKLSWPAALPCRGGGIEQFDFVVLSINRFVQSVFQGRFSHAGYRFGYMVLSALPPRHCFAPADESRFTQFIRRSEAIPCR